MIAILDSCCVVTGGMPGAKKSIVLFVISLILQMGNHRNEQERPFDNTGEDENRSEVDYGWIYEKTAGSSGGWIAFTKQEWRKRIGVFELLGRGPRHAWPGLIQKGVSLGNIDDLSVQADSSIRLCNTRDNT